MTTPLVCPACTARVEPRPPAAVALAVMDDNGDERIFSYLPCPSCDRFVLEVYLDRFMGRDEIYVEGDYGADTVAEVRTRLAACPDPQDKHCECPAHESLARGYPT